MMEFYEVIGSLYPEHENVVATIIEGEDFGEKAVFSKGEIIYESKKGSFSMDMYNKIRNDKSNAPVQIDGQRVFSETLANEKKIVICGGGHISIPIIKIGKMLGFHITVIEDRVKYANNVRREAVDKVLCDDFSKALETIEGDKDTYFIIVTRGHRYDQVCLETIIKKSNAYIGMIGSKVRVRKVKETLMEHGIKEELLKQIYSPIGLNILAQTPEEIAVAIIAEIIQVKNKESRCGGYNKEIMKAIFDEETKDMKKMLCTIVSRKGSAPREVGTKMLIYQDGTMIGTIGGGCVESDIYNKAHSQLRGEDKTPRIYTADMTGADAEEEGMVCGGIVEVLLEVLS